MDPESDEREKASGSNAARISAPCLALREFTSQWFLVPQGTGILAVLLHQLHYQVHGLAIISYCFWILTIVLLVVMLAVYLCRAVRYPSHLRNQLSRNPMETACLASISVTFTTITQMTALSLVTTWGQAWGLAAYVFWWVNLAMAVTMCIGIVFVIARLGSPGVENVPVAIRLPAIAALTVAAGGGVICRHGQLDAKLQAPIVIASYLCAGAGLMVAQLCDAVLLARLLDQSWPQGRSVYTIMIACGPYGQGSFAMQILGMVVQRGAFADHSGRTLFISASSGQMVDTCSVLIALLLWGYASFWWAFACIAILQRLIADAKLLLSWDHDLTAWSLVFPWVRVYQTFRYNTH